MGVKLYVEIKKHEVGFGTYPLCIDTSDKGVEEIINFDATTGAIMCVEGEKNDKKALNIVESSIDYESYIPEMDIDESKKISRLVLLFKVIRLYCVFRLIWG